MFEHPHFDVYTPETLPLNQDLYLRDEIYMADYERSFADVEKGKEWKPVGWVSFVAARGVTPRSIELSWFPNPVDRIHELSITLPREQIVFCVGSWRWDEKPTIFVKSKWLKQIHLRSNCVFGLIDAIGVTDALRAGLSLNKRLPALRSGLDAIASRVPQISFVSFADSVLLKSHWTAGYFRAGVKYSYDPEAFLYLFKEIRTCFQGSLGLKVYAVFTQGSNEYYKDSLLHISESKNHVCLNSLGAPFADGTNNTARFQSVGSLRLDGMGNLYVQDVNAYYPGYAYVRKIAPVAANWVVTTIYELWGDQAHNNNGSVAEFVGNPSEKWRPDGRRVDEFFALAVACRGI